MSWGKVVFALTAAVVFAADRVSKSAVLASVTPGTEIQVAPHLWITNAQNAGAAFGFAQGGSLLLPFLLASLVVTLGLIYYVAAHSVRSSSALVLGLILGGTLGNGYDRLLRGSVTDFVSVHFFPIFNVADSAITIGVLLLVVGFALRPKNSDS
ncbi:MAG: signal peptidase II [Candidatus Dormibacteraceae bacterium]